MLCTRCGKNPAAYHSVKTVNGQRTEEHLCAECARELDLFSADLFSPVQFFKGFFDLPAGHQTVCPVCGSSMEDFRRSGLLGCGSCYDTFSRELTPVLRQMHGNVQHTGAIPQQESEAAQRKKEEAALRKQMEEAIRAENFEEAARLRDAIAAMKEGN